MLQHHYESNQLYATYEGVYRSAPSFPSNLEGVNENAALLDSYNGKNIANSTAQSQTKWCSECSQMTPRRCHHCPLCNICVLRKDHHCFLTGGCVGLANQVFNLNVIFKFILPVIIASILLTIKM